MSQPSTSMHPPIPVRSTAPSGRGRPLLALLVASAALLLLAGCASGAFPLPLGTPSAAQTFGGAIESVLAYELPETPTPTPTPEGVVTVVVSTGGARANIRSTPSLDGAIVGKGDNGQALNVLAQSEDGAWWQVTLPDGTTGWVSNSIVQLAGEGESVPVAVLEESGPLLPDEFQATWEIDWTCESDEGRCTVDRCAALVTAAVNRAGDGQFIPVEYQVEWDDACFSTDAWVFEVNPLTGQERSGEYANNFLYAYWIGAGNDQISGVLPRGSSQGIVVSCNGPQTVEVEEGEGWASVYEGTTCHDQRTGMLVYMNYIKRWLFTGEFEGQNYDRAFFGDVERLEQTLIDTNAELFVVEKK